MTAGSIRKFPGVAPGIRLGETAPRPPVCAGRLGRSKSPHNVRYSPSKNLFRKKVFGIVRRIPKGKTLTYKEIARRAENPNAARAVGAILRTNYDPAIPCHRVVRSDDALGGYNRGVQKKKKLLNKEQQKSR